MERTGAEAFRPIRYPDFTGQFRPSPKILDDRFRNLSLDEEYASLLFKPPLRGIATCIRLLNCAPIKVHPLWG